MHHKLSFRRKLQAFFLSLLLVLLTTAGVPSAAYTEKKGGKYFREWNYAVCYCCFC